MSKFTETYLSDTMSDARVSRIFGRYEEAAIKYAKCAKVYWENKRYYDAGNAVRNASECLIEYDTPEETFEGIRSTSIMLAKVGACQSAMALCNSGFPIFNKFGVEYRERCESLCNYVSRICDSQKYFV